MGLFGIGGESSESRSRSDASSFGLNIGAQGSFSESGSTSTGRSRAGGFSRQSIAFAPIFAELFGGASNVAGRLAARAPQLTDTANVLFSGGLGFLDSLEGGGAGERFLEERLSGSNPVLDEQISLLGEDVGRFLETEILPSIGSRGVAAGTFGGARGEVAKGEAARAAIDEFRRGATSLRAGDIASRDAAAGALMEGRTQAAGVGLSALPGVLGLAQSGFMAELSPFAALADILGGPTVLTEAEDFSVSEQDAISQAISEAFGFDFGFDRSRATSESSSRSRGFNLGFG